MSLRVRIGAGAKGMPRVPPASGPTGPTGPTGADGPTGPTGPTGPGSEEIIYFADVSSSDGAFRVRDLTTNAAFEFDLYVPTGFGVPSAISLIGYPSADIPLPGADNIDLDSEYGNVSAGEQKDNHAETGSTTTGAVSADQWFEVDLASVLTSLAEGDLVGVTVDHMSVGTTVMYIGVRIQM